VLGAGLPVLAVATPAGAATDPGSPWLAAPQRPVAADPSPPPVGASRGGTGLPERPAAAPVGPLATRVEREAAALEALTERLVEQREALRWLSGTATAAEARWAADSERYGELRDRVDTWARSTYVRLAETGSATPGPGAELLSTQAVGTDQARPLVAGLEEATRDLDASGAAYTSAREEADRAQTAVRALEVEHTQRAATLAALRARHRAELEAARVSTDRHNAALSHRYLGDFRLTGDGTPAVRRAVQFALAQLGKPYVWGAEGPDTYDCSGLVQAAYAAAGVALPRTARPQYLATVPVPVAALVPGDLLFFGPDPRNWNSIHHVGIYVGRGLMIHAPTTGDVVRIAPIWWAEFFGATRVLAAGRTAGEAIAIPVSATRPPAATPARGAPAGPRPPNPPAGSPPPPAAGTPPGGPDPAPEPCPAEPLSLVLGPLRLVLGVDARQDPAGTCTPPTAAPPATAP
jgi:cell wall-associated NlpC family hydrolase